MLVFTKTRDQKTDNPSIGQKMPTQKMPTQRIPTQQPGLLLFSKGFKEMKHSSFLEGDGEVDFIDFLHIMHKTIKRPIADDVIEQTFKIIDGEENEFITMRGLEKIFLSLGQFRTDEELKQMLSFIDTQDEEGLVKFEGKQFEFFIKIIMRGVATVVQWQLTHREKNLLSKSRSFCVNQMDLRHTNKCKSY